MVKALKDGAINDTHMATWLSRNPLEINNIEDYRIKDFLEEWNKVKSVGTDEIIEAKQKVTEIIKRLILTRKIIIDDD